MKRLYLITNDWVQIYGDDHGKIAPLEVFNNGKFAFKQIIKVDENFYLKIKFAVPLDKDHLIESANYDDFNNVDDEVLFMHSYADKVFEEKKKEAIQGLINGAKERIVEYSVEW